MNKTVKTITCIVLALVCVFIVYKIYESIMEPVRFNKEADQRKEVAVQQLKDIRDLQVAFKSVYNRFTPSLDSLKDFYKNGEMIVLLQVGSQDDSAAVAHTEAVKKANRKITPEQMYEMYKAGDHQLVFSIQNKIAVKDTLFHSREDFDIDRIDVIPFSSDEASSAEVTKVEMDAVIKKVSGVDVPLFEAKMPWWSILHGMDRQLIVNRVAELDDQGLYPGLMVGSISAPNNNAGNWE